MSQRDSTRSIDNLDLTEMLEQGIRRPFRDRVRFFSNTYAGLLRGPGAMLMRETHSATDRVVQVFDPAQGESREMLMFGSNNYLGLANHPFVRERVTAAIREFGVGTSGPPHFNGYTRLHREAEERLAAFKRMEDAVIFSSGYGANIGVVSGILNDTDTVYWDEYIHASVWDAICMAGVRSFRRFLHNDADDLEQVIANHDRPSSCKDLFVMVDGVYSMDGDVAPLDKIVPICKRHGAILLVDDAHGSGVMGPTGRGTVEHFGLEADVDIITATLGKSFGVVGGFVAASREICDFVRMFARSYVFSNSIPPAFLAGIIAGTELIERDPSIRERLHANVQRATKGLQAAGFDIAPEAAILVLKVPPEMNILAAATRFHELGVFVNYVPFPAVPADQQRFRISVSACHEPGDIDKLVTAICEVWEQFAG